MRYFIVWGFTAGSFELSASDEADYQAVGSAVAAVALVDLQNRRR